MQVLLVLGFGLACGLFWWVGSRYKAGESPFDKLPPGVPAKPAATWAQTVDGKRYRVSAWNPGLDGRAFRVAEARGKPKWIAFWSDAAGKRTLYLSLASAGDLNDLRKDWAL